ncbi:interleukin-12 receptor subunit beta-2 [Pelodytes ibericus]
MVASPGTVLHLGSSVTITCMLTRPAECCPKSQCLTVTKKHGRSDVQMGKICNNNSISIHDPFLSSPRTTYVCYTSGKQVCGIYIYAGVSPDQPVMVTCEKEEDVDTMLCSWENGRETYIETNYIVQLTALILSCRVCRGSCIDHMAQSGLSSKHGIQFMAFPFSLTRGEEFEVTVTANNSLGKNSSLPYLFSYYDAVKPNPPHNISIEFNNDSRSCSVGFPGHSLHFRLRYRGSREKSWNEVEVLGTQTAQLFNLIPFTTYEFWASQRFLTDKGKWSNWSQPVMADSPEAVPTGKIDVWYRLQKTHDNNWNIQLFWENMAASQARGIITHYEVLFYKEDDRGPAYIHTATDTWFTSKINITDIRVVTVAACNSKGNSPPTHLNVTAQDVSDLSSPINVAARGADHRMTVTWDESPENKISPADHIVEWEVQGERRQGRPNWLKVPKFNRSAVISGNLAPGVCYEIRVYALQKGRVGIGTRTSSSILEKAPLMDPEFHYKILSHNRVLVKWQEIPLEKQMGCIIQYSIYTKNLASKIVKVITVFANESITFQYEINNLQQGVQYLIWMTGSTAAGESMGGLVQQLYIGLEGSLKDYMKIILVITLPLMLLGVFICAFPSVRQRLLLFISGIVPRWCIKTVPDPANCSWVKDYTNHTNKLGFSHQLSDTSNYDETETLEIREMDSDDVIMTSSPLFTMEHQEDVSNTISHMADPLQPNIDTEHFIHPKIIPQYPSHPNPLGTELTADYLVNQDISIDYLPSHMLQDADGSSEDDHFPTQLVMPAFFVAEGKLKLDAVRIRCSLFVEEGLGGY